MADKILPVSRQPDKYSVLMEYQSSVAYIKVEGTNAGAVIVIPTKRLSDNQ